MSLVMIDRPDEIRAATTTDACVVNVLAAAIVVVAVWLEVASRLRFEWTINPQYGYGWAVPFAAAFLLWKRWTVAPAPSRATGRVVAVIAMLLIPLVFIPVRLIQEANPDWRLMGWTASLAAV